MVKSPQDALSYVTGGGIIIYTTEDMIPEAARVSARYPKIPALVFAGTIPKGEAALVSAKVTQATINM